MKKIKILLLMIISALTISLFGACSCGGESKISITSFTVSDTEIDVVVGEEFDITYTILPKASTNKKVDVSITSGQSYVDTKDSVYLFDGDSSETVTFKAKAKGGANPSKAVINFTTQDGNYSREVTVNIYNTPEQLQAPTNLKYENGKVSWDEVENASSYLVVIDGNEYTAETLEFTPTLTKGVEHSIKVAAVSNSILYSNSDNSKEIKVFCLDTPQITSIENGLVSWNSVEKATHYLVEYASNETQLLTSDTTYFDCSDRLQWNAFNVKVKALYYHTLDGNSVSGDIPFVLEETNNYVITSDNSKSYAINRLVAPTQLGIENVSQSQITNGLLSWIGVEGATNYHIELNDGTKKYEFDTSETTIDFNTRVVEDEFEYLAGNYIVSVKAEGNKNNTISGEFSESTEFSFTKLPYLNGSIDSLTNTLTINTSSLVGLGVSDEKIAKLGYEIIFVNENSTIFADRNYTYRTDQRQINLSDLSNLEEGKYTKTIIRPYVKSEDKTLANAHKNNIIDEIYPYASGFTKLPSAKITSISNESVVTFQMDSSNVENFVVTLTDKNGDSLNQTISKEASFVSINDIEVSIDLTMLDLTFGTKDMVAGNYTLHILPTNSTLIDACKSECTIFNFIKNASVSSIQLVDGRITWANVSGNFGYKTSFNNFSTTVYENNFKPESINNSNNFSIVVLGNNQNIINSDIYSPEPILRATPINEYSLTNGVLSWQEETGATYVVKYYLEDKFQKEETISKSSYSNFNLTQETRIAVVKKVTGKFDSAETTFVRLSQLSEIDTNSVKVVNNAYLLTFDEVENASGYELSITDAQGYLHTSIYALTDVEVDEGKVQVSLNSDYFTIGQNSVKVTALGDSIASTSTNSYFVCSKVTNPVTIEVFPNITANVNAGVMNWSIDSTNTPAAYRLTISKEQLTSSAEDLVVDIPTTLRTGSFDWTQYPNGDVLELPSGTYNVVVDAFGDTNANVINGNSTLFTFTKLPGTSLSVINGEIIFDYVNNANGYKVFMYDMDGSLISETISTSISGDKGKVVINSSTLSANTQYQFAIKVLGGNNLNSSLSEKRTVVKLASVNNFAKHSDTLTWDNVANNAGYVINGKNGFTYNNTTAKDATSLAFPNGSFENKGRYIVEIIALGSSTTGASDIGYLNSDETNITIVKLNDVTNLTLSDGVLSWNTYSPLASNETPVSTQVVVTLAEVGTKFTYNTNGTSINLSEKADLSAGSYTITVQHLGNGDNLIDSAILSYNEGAIVERIASTNMSVTNGKIVFNKVANASGYRLFKLSNSAADEYVQVEDSVYTIVEGDTTCEIVLNSSAITTNTNTSLKLMTIAETNSNYINSNLSDVLVVNKLTAIQDLRIGEYLGVGERLIWTPVTNAVGYVLQVVGTNTQYFDITGQSTCYYDIADLTLEAGNYTVKVYAQAGSNTGLSVGYLNSELSNSVTIHFVSDRISVGATNGVLIWDSVEGVSRYQLTINNGTSKEYRYVAGGEGKLSYDLNNDEFISDSNLNYTLSVVPASFASSYYQVQDSDIISLVINKAKPIYDLGVKNGIISWKVNVTDLTSDDIVRAYAFYEKYKKDPYATENTQEDLIAYQKYYSYWNFVITLNNKSYDIIPDSYAIGVGYVEFFYEIDEIVTEITKYEIFVKAKGNSTCLDADGNIILDGSSPASKTYISSINSPMLTAYKSTVPDGVVSKDGKITFNLVTKVTGSGESISTDYEKDYYLYATPASQSYPKLLWSINVPMDYTEYNYTIDVKELGLDSNNNSVIQNIKYDYTISTRGSFAELYNSTNVIMLKSNIYTTVSITFLSNIEISYSDRDSNLGGIIRWDENILGDFDHKLYLMEESLANSAGNNWWKSTENLITITLGSKEYSFTFDDSRAKEAGIKSNTIYRVAAKYAGDGETFITNGDNPDSINVTTLNALTFELYNGSYNYIKNGRFTWNAVANCTQYKVVVYTRSSDGKINESQAIYTSNNYFEITGLDDTQSYSIRVTPLGGKVQVGEEQINYVNGFSNEPSDSNGRKYFSRLSKITNLRVEYKKESNVITWDKNDNALNYTININGVVSTDIDNEYPIPNNWGPGEYQISVKANSKSNNHLNGLYCESVSVLKLYEPELRVVNGEIVWARSQEETVSSSNTLLTITKCNEDGSINSGQTSKNVTITDKDTLSYNFEEEPGYYIVTLQFMTQEFANNIYQLSSNECKIMVNKLAPISKIENGSYNGEDCNFDNYVKWQIDDDAAGYKVELFNKVNGESIQEKIHYMNDASDSDYFVISGLDSTYLCFNLKKMTDSSIFDVEVRVTALGNTTNYLESFVDIKDTLGYLTSEYISHNVSIPNASPRIISFDKGVIKWQGGANYAENGGLGSETIVTEEALAQNVEIVIVEATTYQFDKLNNSRSEASISGEQVYNWIYEEGKEQVFYSPYATHSSIKIKLRYYNSNFTSQYTPVFTLTNNELFYAGTGTQNDPYIIYDESETSTLNAKTMFKNIAYRPNSYFNVMEDIDMTDMTWTMIENFGGTIYGQNHIISNLRVNNKLSNGVNNTALFKNILNGSEIQYLTFDNIQIHTSITNQNQELNIASIAINNNGKLTNLTINGFAYGYAYKNVTFGGVTIINNGEISNCNINLNAPNTINATYEGVYMCSNTQNSRIGGVAATNYGLIENVTINSNMTAISNDKDTNYSSYIGGVTYDNKYVDENSLIRLATVLSSSKLKANNVGGIAYQNDYNARIEYSSMLGVPTIVGYNEFGTTKQSVTTRFGGIVALNRGYITSSYAYMTTVDTDLIQDNCYFGGLVGFNATLRSGQQTGKVINSFAIMLNITYTDVDLAKKPSVVGYIDSATAGDYENIFVRSATGTVIGSSGADGNIDIPVQELKANDNNIMYTLSGVGNEADYNVLSIKFVANTDYSSDNSEVSPYVISQDGKIVA